MEWSKKIVSIAGIPIRLHFSLALLLLWIFYNQDTNNPADSFFDSLLTFIFLIFSVAAHELGHALMAKKFNVRTRDIILYPFGGIASLMDRMTPAQEFWITVAGPAVNLLIAALVILSIPGDILSTQFFNSPAGVLLALNLALAIFNLIPAYPMDGGRILRASLKLMGVKSATKICSRFSQAVCIGLAILAFIYGNLLLFVIAGIVFLGASRELLVSRTEPVTNNLTAKEVMIPLSSLLSLSPSQTVESAANYVLRTAQTHFPVLLGEQFLGVVDREDLLQRTVSNIENFYITQIMLKNLPCCLPESLLTEVFELFAETQSTIVLVEKSNQPLGLIFRDQLESLMLIRHAVRQNIEQRELEKDFGAI